MTVLHGLFGSHMVLQRRTGNRIIGMDEPGQRICLVFYDKCYETRTNEEGYWEIQLEPMEAGGPYIMHIEGSSLVILEDILVGDVYLLSGQSNMELRMFETVDVTPKEDLETEIFGIRYLRMEPQYSFGIEADRIITSGWKKAKKDEIALFSAAGFYFAKEIHAHENIPVGLVNTAVGGSGIEAWMREETLNLFEDYYRNQIEDYRKEGALLKKIKDDEKQKEGWLKELLAKEHIDKDCEWEGEDIFFMPACLDTLLGEGYYGSVWMKREVTLEKAPVTNARLRLGLMIDEEEVWINGIYIGRGFHRYETRNYTVPADALKAGKNTILIRLVLDAGRGGAVEQKPYFLEIGSKRYDLGGEWELKRGAQMQQPAPQVLFPPLLPLGLYYGMLCPIRFLQFQAVLWYQGETNAGHRENYTQLFEAMCKDWERLFGRRLKICSVQLASYNDPLDKDNDMKWGMVREYQRRCAPAATEEYRGLVSAVDVGERFDLHPHNKRAVGERLSLWARRFIYHEQIEYRGPVIKEAIQNEKYIVLTFDHDGANNSGQDFSTTDCMQYDKICVQGQKLHGFEISYDDERFFETEAVHDGHGCVRITLKDDKVVKSIRFAWQDYVEDFDFYNQYSIPAETFCIHVL